MQPPNQPNTPAPQPVEIPVTQQLYGQVPQMQQIPQMQQMPQVVYVNLNYSPEVNYRNWSYLPLGIGIMSYFGFLIFGFGMGMGDEGPAIVGNASCCFFLGIASALDAVHYKGKSDWQMSSGLSNTGSMVGMIVDILFSLFCLGFALILMIGLFV